MKTKKGNSVKNLHKAAAVSVVAGSLAVLGAGVASATTGGAHAGGAAMNSSGIVSGNVIQAPIHVPVNVCGNTVSVVGLLNPAAGNLCVNK
jgi:ChpA-C